VGGFVGGHSGVDIHEQRGNAVRFLMEWLSKLNSMELVEWRGGKAHNIIPRDAFALVRLENTADALKVGEEIKARWLNFLPENDQKIFVKIEEVDQEFSEVMSAADTKKAVSFMLAFPHGAHKMDLATGRKLVSLSNNQAVSLLVRGQFYLQSSLRFFDRGECVTLENQIQSLAYGFGFDFKKNGEYPSWKPVKNNQLLKLATDSYEKLYQQPAKVTAIHAGLECGILRDKIGPIDAVSFGPTITGAHSPDERVNVPTVEKFWYLFVDILKNL
jgi:dipeptidase D